MGKRKEQRKAAYNIREEEKAKKVLRNVIIALVVIAVGFIAVSIGLKYGRGCLHPLFIYIRYGTRNRT